MLEESPYPSKYGIVKWITTSWLEENIDENLHIIDCQPNVHDYISEHIPSSVYLNPSLLRTYERNLPAVYIPELAIQSIFRRIGLNSGTPTVVYSGPGAFKHWGDGLEQTMIAYSLARFGHNQVYILDGGIDKWKQEGRPLTKKYSMISPSSYTPQPRPEYWISYEIFRSLIDKKNVVVFDARPPELYRGQGPWIKPGHVPGALSLPGLKLVDEKNPRLLKSKHEIESIIESYNISKDNVIICMCGTGREATLEFLLFKWFLQYPSVKIYEGSFTEWVSYPENPTVSGDQPTKESSSKLKVLP